MNLKELKKLTKAITSYGKKNSTNFSLQGVVLSYEAMNETLKEEINSMCQGGYIDYERNKLDLFELIQESVDAILPPELEKFFEGFCDVKQYGNNDKPEITLKKTNKNLRARSFVTKVSPAGVYEVFRLSKQGKFTIEMQAVGGAAQISLEDFLNGRIDWNEMLEVITLGMQDRLYEEIMATLAKIERSLPTANKGSSANFDPKPFEKVLGTVSIYGSPIIYCTEVFAREITEGTDWASEDEKKARRNVGYLANYKNAKIVILPQSFKDETNTEKVIDDSKAYIFPAGRQGLIQIALQGDTQVKDIDNEDWSKEIQTYKKFGLAAIVFNDIATYEITSLKV